MYINYISCSKSSYASKGEGVNKRKVKNRKGVKTATIWAYFRGAAHWVVGTVHPSGTTHWDALCNVKVTQARCIEVVQRT